MPVSENQIVVYQPNETVRLLESIRKAASEQREYGKGIRNRAKNP